MRMTKARKRILIAIMLSLVTFLATFAALRLYTSAQTPVPVSVEPPEVTVNPGQYFAVDVVVLETQEPLDAFDIMVNYNPAYMTPTSFMVGPIVPPEDAVLFDFSVPGSVHFWDLPPNGFLLLDPGVVAQIEFQCIDIGQSSISVHPGSLFYDPTGAQIPVNPISGSLVTQSYPPAHTYIQPPTVTVPMSTPFTVDVNVQDVTNLYMFQLVLNYNTLYVDAIDIVPGSFLPQPIVLNKVIDDPTGTIIFDVQSGIPGNGISGSGDLARITFHCTGAGESILTITTMKYYDPSGFQIPTTTADGRAIQFTYWEPIKLQNIVELPYPYALVDLPFVPPGSPAGYAEIRSLFESKGYMFDVDNGGSKWVVESFFDVFTEIRPMEELNGTVTSWWSTNMLADGTKACLLSAEMADGTSMAMGFITNLLPPEQMPGVDPYIIWNAEPYFYVQFYWWSWNPINRIITWSYWWHDSHNHPNWFWGVYWWWRTYTKAYYLGYWPPIDVNWVYWRPWWGWWWHWVYWQHWHWWSAYFPYDP